MLELGLTIGGKPLRDHQEVYGHARAIDLIYEMVVRAITREDLFALHRAVMPLSAVDSLNPVCDWKKILTERPACSTARAFIWNTQPQPMCRD